MLASSKVCRWQGWGKATALRRGRLWGECVNPEATVQGPGWAEHPVGSTSTRARRRWSTVGHWGEATLGEVW